MKKATLYSDWKEKIVYGTDGPEPQILMADEKVKVILGGLKPGQKIPNHRRLRANIDKKLPIDMDARIHSGSGATAVINSGIRFFC